LQPGADSCILKRNCQLGININHNLFLSIWQSSVKFSLFLGAGISRKRRIASESEKEMPNISQQSWNIKIRIITGGIVVCSEDFRTGAESLRTGDGSSRTGDGSSRIGVESAVELFQKINR
jgi:hypothetical protein